VRPALLPSALALNSTTFNLSRLIGPALAAPLLAFEAAGAVFVAAFLANLAFAAIMARIALRRRPRQPLAPARMLDVMTELLRSRVLAAVIGTQFAQGVLIRPASELFPAFADVAFGAGASALSLLNAAMGGGAILGAIAFSRPRDDANALWTVAWTSVLLCLSLLLFSFTGLLWWGAALLIVHGAMMSSSNNIALTYVQSHVAPERMGRVLAVYGIVYRAAPAIGALAFGSVAEIAGLGVTTAAFSVAGGATVLFYWASVRRAELA
jgi:predicted MFS family arabinose efflux permease